MSSESVTTGSSRLRQFGLYRTIDSRTEEFLKLSRRRQIRQGCACAAVSTVITVTIVVIVLLIYEYGFRVEYEVPPKTKYKQNWIGMLNDSDASFDKTHRANFNIDRNALKLLPLILKAIKQNKYMDKVIDDSSQTPNNEKHTTEFPIQRNVFTDARNWIRMPPSRMYAIEYKTSPIVFFKSRNLETFAKARKMMESQRIMNYLDKMLSEKVNSGPLPNQVKNGESSSTIKTTTVSDESPAKTYLQYIDTDSFRERITPTWKGEPPATEGKELESCKCPSNLGEILKKLARNIEQLLPDSNERKLDISKPCSKSKTTTVTPNTVTTKKFSKITNKSGKTNEASLIEHRNQQKTLSVEPKLEMRPEEKLINAKNIIENIPNQQRRTPHKDLSDIVIASYKKKHSKCKGTDRDQTTTVKWNIEPTEFITFNSITTSKPMTSKSMTTKTMTTRPVTFKLVSSKPTTIKPTTSKPMAAVTSTKLWRITTEENFVIAHQYNENIFSGSKDYSKQSKFAHVATTFNPEVSIDKTVDEIKTKSKKMSLKQFLQNQKEGLSKNRHFKGTLSDVYKAEISDLPAMKTFNTKRNHNEEKKDFQPKVDSNTTNILINNEISNIHVDNNTKTRSVESLMAITDEDFENILPELIETDAILLNETALAESLRKLDISSQEVSQSILPQSRPSFLEIRRNEGRHDDADYDPDTLNNLNVYD
ncbi:uncharacterized protein isoform X1 [Choristoneura fumiferana]|uniref:uncharacterized protein isoform X1 n=1 Tax=Choristoneura fumiferana TaxID=7141 RepID=UPI003D153CE8